MRLRFGIALMLALALVATACGDDDSGAPSGSCAKDELNLVQPGMLTIATGEPAFPPWVVDDDPTNKMGFEAAVAYAIAGEMGFTDAEVSWVRTDFNEAIAPGDKNFDFNIQQYSITDARDEVVDFSDPYYTTAQALVAFADSPVASATSIDDLKQYKLGAQIGTTSLAFIEDVIEPDSDAAVYDTNVDAKSGLDAGQVDALVFDLPTAFFITAVEIPEATIVGQLEAEGDNADRYGLLFAEGNSLVDCVNDAISALEDAGTLETLAEEWLAGAGDIPTLEQ